RQARPAPGIPVLSDAATMVAAYLTEECEMGRIAADADVDALALSLIGAGHMLFADRERAAPGPEEVGKVVNAVIADVVQRRLL
ncbi:TetR/AcrR family transcriptional regulator, partial [Streptosporangium algeriense]